MSFASELAAHGPLVHFPLNESAGAGTVNDQGSVGQDATVRSGVTLGGAGGLPNEPGGTSAYLDGTVNAYLDTASYLLSIGNAFTCLAWVKPDASTLNARRGIFGQAEVAFGFWLEIGLSARNGQMGAYFPGTLLADTVAGVVAEDVWQQIAYARSGTGAGTHKFNVNGADKTLNADGAGNFADVTAARQLGRRSSGTPQNYKGYLQHVAVIPSALTTGQLLSLYNAGMAALGAGRSLLLGVGPWAC